MTCGNACRKLLDLMGNKSNICITLAKKSWWRRWQPTGETGATNI